MIPTQEREKPESWSTRPIGADANGDDATPRDNGERASPSHDWSALVLDPGMAWLTRSPNSSKKEVIERRRRGSVPEYRGAAVGSESTERDFATQGETSQPESRDTSLCDKEAIRSESTELDFATQGETSQPESRDTSLFGKEFASTIADEVHTAGEKLDSDNAPGSSAEFAEPPKAAIQSPNTTDVTGETPKPALVPNWKPMETRETHATEKRVRVSKDGHLRYRGVPRMEGHLYKWTNYLKGWQRRLFVLENGVLSYYVERSAYALGPIEDAQKSTPPAPTQTGTSTMSGVSLLSPRRLLNAWHGVESTDLERACKGRINLQLAVITRHDTDLSRLIIDTGTQIYHLRAESNDLCQQWMEALLRSKTYFERLARRAAARRLRAVSETTESSSSTPGEHAALELTARQANAGIDTLRGTTGASLTTEALGQKEEQTATDANPVLDVTAADEDEDDEEARMEREFGEEDEATLQARQAHEELLSELVRLQSHVREAVTQSAEPDLLSVLMQGLLGDQPPREALGNVSKVITVLSALLDLITWSIHVLHADGALWRHRLVTERARALRAEAESAALQRQLDVFLREIECTDWFQQSTAPSTRDADARTEQEDEEDEFFDAGSSAFGTGSTSPRERSSIPSPAAVQSLHSVCRLGPLKVHSFAERTSAVLERLRALKLDAIELTTRTDAPSRSLLPTKLTEQFDLRDRPDQTPTVSGSKSDDLAGQETVRREPRRRLPISDSETPPKPSLWSILKDAVGKDLSRISIPVVFNEPISFLQRLVEDIEASALLDRAVETADPSMRMLLVAAFAVSHYSSTLGRTGKPFNPLLGETYEFVAIGPAQTRMLCEQVSHHPPVSASHAIGTDGSWTYSTTCEVRNKFWGKSVEVFPHGMCHIRIPRYNDHITYQKATTCVHNILVGKMWIDNYGEMVLVNQHNKYRCVVKLTKTGAFWGSQDTYGAVRGRVFDANGRESSLQLTGSWLSALRIERLQQQDVVESETVWTRPVEPPPGASGPFHMTQFAIALNELNEELRPALPPTDSRLRPDQRLLENADYTKATAEKIRLEEKQRAARKAREQRGQGWKPLWFDACRSSQTGEIEWQFNNRYWLARERRDWSQCPDIF
jgi:hypothetical protein